MENQTEKRLATVPDFNINQHVEAAMTTVGAYATALATAGVCGILTGCASLMRGGLMGIQATYQNLGDQKVEVQNTAQKPTRSILEGPEPTPATSKTFGLEDISEEDLLELIRIKRERQLVGTTNGH